jgi:topoisomerase-4 subunit A
VILDSKGRVYALDAHEVPTGRGDGVPVTSLIDLQDGAGARYMLSDAPERRYLFANTGGYGFIAPFSALVGRNRAGKSFMTLEPDEAVLPPAAVDGGSDALFDTSPGLACASSNGKLLCFALDEVKAQDKGRGTVLMHLDKGERLAWIGLYRDTLSIPVMLRGKAQRLVLKGDELARHVLHRARKGLLLPRKAIPIRAA